MPFNYIEIIGGCFPGAEAHVPSGGDLYNYDDLVWITTPIDKATLEASDCAINPSAHEQSSVYVQGDVNSGETLQWDGTCWHSRSVAPAGLGDWDEVVEFYKLGASGNAYMSRFGNLSTEQYPHFITMGPGRIVHVSSIREKSPEKYVQLEFRKKGKQTVGWKDPNGTWTNFGTSLMQSSTELAERWTNLEGYTFSADEVLTVYVNKSAASGDSCEDPFIKLYIKYD